MESAPFRGGTGGMGLGGGAGSDSSLEELEREFYRHVHSFIHSPSLFHSYFCLWQGEKDETAEEENECRGKIHEGNAI